MNEANNLALAKLAEQSIRGQAKWSLLHEGIHGDIAHPDALHDAVRLILLSGEAETLRSLLRCCQRELERSA